MPITVNRNTTQRGMEAGGDTGAQVIKFIPGPRVYVKDADPLEDTPVQNYYTKSNGTTPSGWTDLGSVEGFVRIVYEKQTEQVRTGIDNVFRAAYVSQKAASFEFNLMQADDVALEEISGLTGSVISDQSIVAFRVGEEDLVQKALMLVVQNKLDGKEIQFYNPAAYLNFTFEEQNNALVLRGTGFLPFFTPEGQTAESVLHTTIYA